MKNKSVSGRRKAAVGPKRANGHLPLTISRRELLVGNSDREFRRLVHGLFGFFARHETIRNGHAARIGLAGAEYTVLISIAHLAASQQVNVKTIAEHLHVSGTFVTRIVNKLVRRNLVAKRVDEEDRRRVTLTLQAAGRRRLDRLAPSQRQINDLEFGCLSAQEFAVLIDLTERLIEASENAVRLQRYLLKKQRATG
jgi:DNA-binding MarR family transcriptional regulator